MKTFRRLLKKMNKRVDSLPARTYVIPPLTIIKTPKQHEIDEKKYLKLKKLKLYK